MIISFSPSYQTDVPLFLFSSKEQNEDSLDRENPAETIRKFLRQFEERNLHIDEIWDARREQLERNKILNKNFCQFEKDTREVILTKSPELLTGHQRVLIHSRLYCPHLIQSNACPFCFLILNFVVVRSFLGFKTRAKSSFRLILTLICFQSMPKNSTRDLRSTKRLQRQVDTSGTQLNF